MHFINPVLIAKGRTSEKAIRIGLGFINDGVQLFFINSLHRAILWLNLVITVSLQQQTPAAHFKFIFILLYFYGYSYYADVTVLDDYAPPESLLIGSEFLLYGF